MKRNVDMNEISDGKRYSSSDMVKIDCNDCLGCSLCCHDMGTSIVLDPLDFYRLTKEVKMSPEQSLSVFAELNAVDGIVLPNIRMQPETSGCFFLNEEGRCSVHDARPGFCRLFPLGRIYENGSFTYFNQINECPASNRTKVKIKDWLGEKRLKDVEEFVLAWHNFLKEMESLAEGADDESVKNLSMIILSRFYLTPYSEGEDFFTQFYGRVDALRSGLGL